jgi:hypothetical protein
VANKTIPDLPSGSAFTGAEPFETVQGPNSVKKTLDEIYDYITGVTPNNQSGTTYIPTLLDNQQTIICSNASAITFTIPANASVAFPVGATLIVVQGGAGVITFAAAVGVTLNSNGALVSSNGQWAVCGLQKIATNTWILSGNLI